MKGRVLDSFQKYVIATATPFRHFEWGHSRNLEISYAIFEVSDPSMVNNLDCAPLKSGVSSSLNRVILLRDNPSIPLGWQN